MHKSAFLALFGLLALTAQPALAQSAPPQTKLVGVVAAMSGRELDLTAADGGKLVVLLDDKTRVVLSMPISIDEIKPGSFVGAGAMVDGKGGNTAVEITVFPESARGLGEGFRKWDQGPNSTMTNGTVSQVVGTSNRTLTVTYKGGQQSVTIPDGTPIATFASADASALQVGAHVVVRARKGGDGTLTAGFITVGKDGSVPPG
ncbi:MAG: DUF5666 domain-containing protein [Devosia sp.]|nr:DUF5666 domain-containing protein [Devosia sp.]